MLQRSYLSLEAIFMNNIQDPNKFINPGGAIV